MSANTINMQNQQSAAAMSTQKNESLNNNTTTLNNKSHLPENTTSNVFIPLCAKPSFLALLDEHPHLLEATINHTLATTTTTQQNVLIFIADGAVMEEAFMAMDRPARAHRITSSVADQIEIKVNDALSRINNPRIKGVVHWDELVANSTRFQQALESMERIMKADDANNDSELIGQVQFHIKTLVKNLFTQRVEKARKTGNNITNVFTGEGLEIRKGGKYIKRYNHLERACFLELCIILVGLEFEGEIFTEMRYLTNDPQGMTFIASCLEDLRQVFRTSTANNDDDDDNNNNRVLIEAGSISHGITFVEQQQEPKQQQSTTSSASNKILPVAKIATATAA